MPKYPTDVQYSRTHEWVREEDGLYTVGISDYAQDSLGDIVFVNLPEAGDEVTKGEAFAFIALHIPGLAQLGLRGRIDGNAEGVDEIKARILDRSGVFSEER